MYFFSLGIPEWLRNKLWPLMIGNECSINENIFNFYLKQVEVLNFSEIFKNMEDKIKSNPLSGKNNPLYLSKANLDMLNFDKSMKKLEIYVSAEPLLNDIIIDIINITKKFQNEIELKNLEKFTIQKELFDIVRVLCLSRPDITYSKQITYISLILYLNSENYYNAFVNLSNLILSSYLIKFLTNDETFVKIIYF